MKINQDTLVNKREKGLKKNMNVNKLQESIFGVLYVLLKDDESNVYLFFFLSFTEFLEFLNFPFSTPLMIYWDNSQIANQINNFIGYINIVNYLNGTSKYAYLSVYFFFVLIVILVICNIIYVSISFSRNYFTYTWPLIVLTNVAKFFVTILFMPIFELFLSMFVCYYNDELGEFRNSITSEIVCFQSLHIFYMVISCLVSIAFLIICYVVAINFFEFSELCEEIEAK